MGLQLLFTRSEEGGEAAGLDIVQGNVKKFPPGDKVPQMGWNSVRITESGKDCPLLDGIKDISVETARVKELVTNARRCLSELSGEGPDS